MVNAGSCARCYGWTFVSAPLVHPQTGIFPITQARFKITRTFKKSNRSLAHVFRTNFKYNHYGRLSHENEEQFWKRWLNLIHTTVNFIWAISAVIPIVTHISPVDTRSIGTLESKAWAYWDSWGCCGWRRRCWNWSIIGATELGHWQVINGNVTLIACTADTFNNNLEATSMFLMLALKCSVGILVTFLPKNEINSVQNKQMYRKRSYS